MELSEEGVCFCSWGREARIIPKHYFGERNSGLDCFYLVFSDGFVTVFKHKSIKFPRTSAGGEF